MPYIPRSARQGLNPDWQPCTPGELNYAITRLLVNYLHLYKSTETGRPSYEHIAEAIAACTEAAAELRRRVLAPYEDLKCAENGDMYPREWTT